MSEFLLSAPLLLLSAFRSALSTALAFCARPGRYRMRIFLNGKESGAQEKGAERREERSEN